MRITDIRLTKRGRISVYIDGEFACVLHPDVYSGWNYRSGDLITPEALEEIQAVSRERMAKEYALNLLSGRSYTCHGLSKKLRDKDPELEEETARRIVSRMEELGLVDDRDYARRFAADCLKLKKYSPSRTAQALREKGISKEIADESLAMLTEEYDAEPVIARLVLQKYLRHLSDEKGVAKTIAALQRRGFRYGEIRTVLQNLAEDLAYYDEDQAE